MSVRSFGWLVKELVPPVGYPANIKLALRKYRTIKHGYGYHGETYCNDIIGAGFSKTSKFEALSMAMEDWKRKAFVKQIDLLKSGAVFVQPIHNMFSLADLMPVEVDPIVVAVDPIMVEPEKLVEPIVAVPSEVKVKPTPKPRKPRAKAKPKE